MVQVSSPIPPGYGGQASKPPGWQDSPRPTQIIPDIGGNGIGAGPGPFDPRGAIQIPNNFWGFVMLMMGMKS